MIDFVPTEQDALMIELRQEFETARNLQANAIERLLDTITAHPLHNPAIADTKALIERMQKAAARALAQAAEWESRSALVDDLFREIDAIAAAARELLKKNTVHPASVIGNRPVGVA